MIYRTLKNFHYLWRFLVWVKTFFVNLSRLKDIFLMMIVFNMWPEQTYRFSTRKFLPSKKNKFNKKVETFYPYELLKNKSSSLKKIKEINVVIRGSSFDLNDIKKIDGPIFLASFWYPLVMDSKGNISARNDMYYSKNNNEDHHLFAFQKHFNNFFDKNFDKKNFTYINNRVNAIKHFTKQEHQVLCVMIYTIDKNGNYNPLTKISEKFLNENPVNFISLAEKVYRPPLLKPNPEHAPTGSVLPSLYALSHLAEKVNVYGWDFYLNSSPKKMSYWQLFFNMYKYGPDKRSKNHFESALINFYYGYQLSKLPNFNIYGYLGQLDNHGKLIKKIERVLFN